MADGTCRVLATITVRVHQCDLSCTSFELEQDVYDSGTPVQRL